MQSQVSYCHESGWLILSLMNHSSHVSLYRMFYTIFCGIVLFLVLRDICRLLLHILIIRKEFKNETQAYFQRWRDRTHHKIKPASSLVGLLLGALTGCLYTFEWLGYVVTGGRDWKLNSKIEKVTSLFSGRGTLTNKWASTKIHKMDDEQRWAVSRYLYRRYVSCDTIVSLSVSI